MTSTHTANLDRRSILKNLSLGLFTLPLLPAMGGSRRAFAQAFGQNQAGAWVQGTTALLKSTYPSPFTAIVDSSCAINLTCQATLGPCYAETLERKDISEGQSGIPMRMALRILNDQCEPVEGAIVDVWHTSSAGLYSGDDTSTMCTLGDAGAVAARYFRGIQKTDADGVVEFDSCFPGWYSSRTIHIHYSVTIGEQNFLTSQFVFDDTLVDDIVANYSLYSDRGPRDTTNQNDNVVSAAAAPLYSFDVKRMDDGAMLASKTIIVRSSTGDTLCSIPGGSGGPGGGGGPGGPGGGAGGPPPGGAGGPPPGFPGSTSSAGTARSRLSSIADLLKN